MDIGTIILLTLGWMAISYAIAIRKNREPYRWMLITLIGGLFAVIVLAILPKVEKKDA